MKLLPDAYDPSEAEKRWQSYWAQKAVYAWDEALPRAETYVIDTPPPTVSGMLHMGHVFSYTQADFIARFQRMKGKTVFYPMGFDDNGLPTERLVEKTRKVRAIDMSREDFITLCMQVSDEARADFRALFTSLALSVDWKQEYHTVSAESRRISQMSFLDLIGKGRAYRKLQPMLWDPVDQTAIAQAEVEDKELPGTFNDIAFAIDGSDETITIATTRPEMLPACVAIFYHPDDARYQHLQGKSAIVPLFGITVPILTDEAVEPEKGTGIMMCCTFGDEADIEKWRKHDLPIRLILNKYGKVTGVEGEYAEALNGLKAVAAREKTLELLKASGHLLESKPITHAVKCAERSGAPLEILPTYQWFVKVLDQKTELKEKAAECEWHPPHMKVRMDQWIDGLNWDWCISRQRYFGVPFPVWYVRKTGDSAGQWHTVVADKASLPVNPLKHLPNGFEEILAAANVQELHYNSNERICVIHQDIADVDGHILKGDGHTHYDVIAEADVMDTWATSSVSPQLSSRAITPELADDYARHEKLFPADLRPQAHEIIRTWAFYTLVKAHLHEDTIPWKNLMISGWCLAADKSKMSKSKGNVVTPTDLLATKGADVVRYWASTSRLGADTAFSEDVLKIGRKLVNKLWNATKFVAAHLEHLQATPQKAAEEVASGVISEVTDRWILTRLRRAIEKATREFEAYEYADARAAAEDFFWNDFCDNYLELIKGRVYGNGASRAAQMSAVHTIYHCLDGILRLFAPFVPHVTEELFSHIFLAEHARLGSLHARGAWPEAAHYPLDEQAEAAGKDCVALLEAVRKQKSERNVSIKYPLDAMAVEAQPDYDLGALLENAFGDLKSATNAAGIHSGMMQGNEEPSRIATGMTEDGRFTLRLLFAAHSEVA